MTRRPLSPLPLGLVLLVACGDKDPAPSGDDTAIDLPDGDTALAQDADEDGWDEERDCDDSNPDIFPGATELCNGVDDDCNGIVDDGFADTDGDGTPDCLDTEECDGIDNNGNGQVDEGYEDGDGDGLPDCLDAEECDGVDNDGDGEIDEGFDGDGDGFLACGPDALDCDDADAAISPDAEEIAGNGIDDDCDGVADEERWDSASLIITEIMNNPAAVSDTVGEWFELHNPGEDAVDIAGLTITSDGGGESHLVDAGGPLEIPAGGYLVLGLSSNTSINGNIPVDYVYSDIRLNNEIDDIQVWAGDVLLDEVAWDGGDDFPDPNGASMELDIYGIDSALNDYGAYWCGSVAVGPGPDWCTPGEAGGLCPTVDRDEDGFAPSEGDCNDADATIGPHAVEVEYDGIDNDCDEETLDDDLDEDGYGIADDCNDLDATTYPGSTTDATAGECMYDEDGDGYGSDTPPAGYDAGTDCNDSDDTTYPGSATDATAGECMYDGDGDGYGSDTPPAGYDAGTDCDDGDSFTHPGADEVCDGADNDCDLLVDTDDSDMITASAYYTDADGDGYGDMAATPVSTCLGTGYASNRTDCDDGDASVNPGASETAYDGVDDDCDGSDLVDVDGDGVAADTVGGDDCDDSNAHVFPGQWEDTSDGIDNDCDGATDSADTDSPTALSLSDDSSATITPSSFTFDFCGSSYSSAYVISNGRVLFGSSSTSYSESASSMSSSTGVAVLWDDLNPSTCGTVYWLEESDHVSVYYREVCEYGSSSDTVTATVVFHDDGTVTLDYESVVGISDGLVGISCGAGSTDSSYDLSDVEWTDNAAGLGNGTDNMAYEVWTSGNDISDSTIRFCVQAGSDLDGDDWTDECGDQDDGDSSVYPD